MLSESLAHIANSMLQCGAVKFGAFKLKLHETQPDAPLSPIYFNLRTSDNPKPGPLTDDLVLAIGQELYNLAEISGLKYDGVAGIPNAGDPFANAFTKASPRPLFTVCMHKETREGGRSIGAVTSKITTGKRILLIDDLITQAHSKLEAASAIKSAGGIVAGFLVILDRQQSGAEQLASHGYTLHSLFSITDLLEYYVTQKLVCSKTQNDVLEYIANN